jgi:hypothetical protein
MQDPAHTLERLKQAGADLGLVHEALLTPGADVWQQCSPQLNHAAGLLETVERRLRTDPPLDLELKAEYRRHMAVLRKDLARIHRLMEAAAGSYLGWAQILAAAVNGYNGSGAVPPLEPPTLVSVEG